MLTRTTKTILGLIGGAAVVVGGIAGYEALRKGKPPASGSLSLTAASGIGGGPGSALTATLTFQDSGAGQLAATSVPVAITLTEGGQTQTLSATAQVPALAPGATAPVAISASPAISSAFTGGTVQVVFSAMAQTITGTLQVAANAAVFDFGEASVGTVSGNTGDTLQITLPVVNNGGVAAVPTVTGVTKTTTIIGGSPVGTVEGSWHQTSSPTIQPGATGNVTAQMDGAIASGLAGYSFALAFTVTP